MHRTSTRLDSVGSVGPMLTTGKVAPLRPSSPPCLTGRSALRGNTLCWVLNSCFFYFLTIFLVVSLGLMLTVTVLDSPVLKWMVTLCLPAGSL